MKKLHIPIIILIGLSFQGNAQEKSRKETRGDKYVFNYSYDKAIDSYNHAKNLTLDGQRKLADSYHKMDQDVQSEIVYSKIVSAQSGVLPEDYYNYAEVLKLNDKNDESNKAMEKFSDMKPSDLRAKSFEANKSKFGSMIKDDGKYKITTLKVNTEAEDFGTSFYKNSVVFASSRAKAKMVKRTDNRNGKPFLDMYVSEVKDGELEKPSNFDKGLNTKLHDGPVSFSNDGTFMAFTRNKSHDKTSDKIVELQIYTSDYKDGAKWSEPVAFAYNNEGYSVGQPCLTADGNTMYFTSDMPGGFGGADIYRTTRVNRGEWTKPENLGNSVNTEGDEMFPFILENNGTLYFSSNGHYGLGGLDVFTADLTGKTFSNVTNAGSPLNTKYDDFAVIAEEKTNKGYFSSNRTGGSGHDDIYAIELLNVKPAAKTIQGIAKDKNNLAVPNTFITLKDDKNKTIDTLTTAANGAFTFTVENDKNYKLTGKKEKYTDGDSSTNTFGKEMIVKADVILLTKEEAVATKIVVGADLSKIFTPIYFDLDKFNIRADAEDGLNKIVKVMNDYPALVVDLGAYTDCRDSKEYNQALSEKRAKATVDYIKKRITHPERITGKGYGESKLVNGCSCDGNIPSDCPEEEHQKNRRTEFIIVKK